MFRSRIASISLFLAACLGAGGALGAQEMWAARGAVTSILFNEHMLADLGIELREIEQTAAGRRAHALGFATEPASALYFYAPGGDFEHLDSGGIRHAGGLLLELPEGPPVSLHRFQLQPAEKPFSFDLLDAQGQRWFRLSHAHSRLRPAEAELQFLNMDLSISPELAERLARPDLAGVFIGGVDVTAAVEVPEDAVLAGGCEGNFDGETDVALTSLDQVSQIVRSDGRVAIAPSASLANVGVADVPWFRAILPDQPTGEHPYLVMSFYKIEDGRIRQLGGSDVKHTFFAVNSGCPCPGDQILYAGCGDTYGTFTNSDRYHFAPREEVTAEPGFWESLGSHFDATPVDDFRDHFGEGFHDLFEHRLVVDEDELDTPGATYFSDAWYLVQTDIDIFNSMGYREVDPTFSGNVWTFPFNDSGTTLGSVLDAWVDPLAPPAGGANTTLDTGEGHVQLAGLATDVGGGQHHYEYALMNFDFDRRIDAFALPLPPGAAPVNVDFGDLDDDPGNDWTASITATEIRWEAPAGNTLDWGKLYNFSFDAAAPPGASTAYMDAAEPGSADTLAAATQGPSDPDVPLRLTVTGLCPGAIALNFSGGSPDGNVALLSAETAGAFSIPGGPCAGVELGLQSPKVATILSLDAAGVASISGNIPGSACGLLLQAVDFLSCGPSNVLDLP